MALIGFIEQLLAASPPLYLTPFLREAVTKVFKHMCGELLGNQVEVSRRVAYFLQNYTLRCNYIALEEPIGKVVKQSLMCGGE